MKIISGKCPCSSTWQAANEDGGHIRWRNQGQSTLPLPILFPSSPSSLQSPCLRRGQLTCHRSQLGQAPFTRTHARSVGVDAAHLLRVTAHSCDAWGAPVPPPPLAGLGESGPARGPGGAVRWRCRHRPARRAAGAAAPSSGATAEREGSKVNRRGLGEMVAAILSPDRSGTLSLYLTGRRRHTRTFTNVLQSFLVPESISFQ